MDSEQKSESMLSPYRVLDLAGEKGLLCGKILGDLGADVIKVERPRGDPTRNIGPFYKDIRDPEKSLYWFAFNTSKRGITLNIEKPEGQDIFKKLVEKADVVIESFSPGYMDTLGLGYSSLSQINPRIILTSVSPFGQEGPYRDYKTSDLVSMALSGVLYITGDANRPPVRISFPVAYQFAGTEAALGTLMALYYRNITDEGQQVDISTQWSMNPAQYDVIGWWAALKKIYKRQGPFLIRPNTGIIFRQHWPCKDGYVT
ncbi:MAG: CoA transferase, partial [Candidatus Omnitrophica bacterium]|nr:CoA transferase [Candidatus Omnitrophota bacterium]